MAARAAIMAILCQTLFKPGSASTGCERAGGRGTGACLEDVTPAGISMLQKATQDEMLWRGDGPVDVALTAVLTKGVDKQLGVQWQADDKALGGWPASVRHFRMRGLVLHDGGFSEDFVRTHSDTSVSFLDVSKGREYIGSEWQKEWEGLTINDERFFIAGAYLEAHEHELGYVLFTDSRDVVFGRNPFELMRAMDTSMDTKYVYVQDEWRPNRDLHIPDRNETDWQRMVGYYRGCFDEDMPPAWSEGPLFNCGALGGHVSAMISLLRSMRAQYAKVTQRWMMCDMPVIQRSVFEDFKGSVVSGFPFNGKFMFPSTTEVAAVLHKSSKDDGHDDGTLDRQMPLPYMDAAV